MSDANEKDCGALCEALWSGVDHTEASENR